ncbi:hypothetical protein CEXT_305761 [Caerostris extrusa]|uniref:Uncharacterized protein n=1 Tax=Caerostris extrusa TaxID=172846 RepID=A0AAV4XQC0_CAEEX|nr:hypothetical protein CEXT_305761 [Caerostris extrusa]
MRKFSSKTKCRAKHCLVESLTESLVNGKYHNELKMNYNCLSLFNLENGVTLQVFPELGYFRKLGNLRPELLKHKFIETGLVPDIGPAFQWISNTLQWGFSILVSLLKGFQKVFTRNSSSLIIFSN